MNNLFNTHYLSSGGDYPDSLYSARIFGGLSQQDRMIADKKKSLDRAVLYGYQAAKVKKVNTNNSVRALINPNKVKPDYDDKIISIGFEHNFSVGDVFLWENTNTHWLIYLQDLTELAYFKGDIRKCQYQVFWQDENKEKKSTYIAVRGPVETKTNSIKNSQTTIDVPNYSLSILVPKNEDTLAYFKRYAKFYLPQADVHMEKICWEIEAVDSISNPNIIEVVATENYSNIFTDDVAEGIIDGLVEDPIDPTPNTEIEGESFIRAQRTYIYKYIGNEAPNWSYDNALPIKQIAIDGNTITLKWNSNYRGQFDLKCNDTIKTIVVDSLF